MQRFEFGCANALSALPSSMVLAASPLAALRTPRLNGYRQLYEEQSDNFIQPRTVVLREPSKAATHSWKSNSRLRSHVQGTEAAKG